MLDVWDGLDQENVIVEQQVGFRTCCLPIDQCVILYLVEEYSSKYQEMLYATSVDFKLAFSNTSHDRLWIRCEDKPWIISPHSYYMTIYVIYYMKIQ